VDDVISYFCGGFYDGWIGVGPGFTLISFRPVSIVPSLHHNPMSAVTGVMSVVKENISHVTTNIFHTNNCPTRCNKKQCIYNFASSLYMFRVSATPIIRSTQNCNYNLRYCVATYLQHWSEVAAQKIWPASLNKLEINKYCIIHIFCLQRIEQVGSFDKTKAIMLFCLLWCLLWGYKRGKHKDRNGITKWSATRQNRDVSGSQWEVAG
jgi:hypothetical protein